MKTKRNAQSGPAVRCSAWLDHTVNPPTPLKQVLRAKIAGLKVRVKALQALHDALPEIDGELGAAISRELL